MIKLQTNPDASVFCQPLSALDFEGATELRHHIAGIVRPHLDLVFDLSQVDYIDAFGASALVGSVRRVRAMGGSSRVCHVNPRIRWVLEIIGIDRFLTEAPGPHARNVVDLAATTPRGRLAKQDPPDPSPTTTPSSRFVIEEFMPSIVHGSPGSEQREGNGSDA